MASMRSRGGAAGAAARRSRMGGLRPVYEDFKPTSEWNHHEKGAHVLLYHLPGFVKEQIRIIAESKGILRVHGERLVEGNRWSRFQEEVTVPQGCNLSEIRAKFEDGTLRIIMPIKHDNTELLAETKNNNQQTSIGKELADKIRDHRHPSSSSVAPPLPLPLPLPPPPPSTRQKPPQELRQDNNNLASNHSALPGNNNDPPQHLAAPAHPKPHQELRRQEDNLASNHSALLPAEKSRVDEESRHHDHGFSNLKNLRKGIAGGRGLNEDRQLLMNMGAAILVIMALGASITYSIGTA